MAERITARNTKSPMILSTCTQSWNLAGTEANYPCSDGIDMNYEKSSYQPQTGHREHLLWFQYAFLSIQTLMG